MPATHVPRWLGMMHNSVGATIRSVHLTADLHAQPEVIEMSPIIVFDVNETLLDLGVLDELFERHLGNAGLRPLWFTQVINTAITATIRSTALMETM